MDRSRTGTESELKLAIEQRLVVELSYSRDGRIRVVHPHALFVSSADQLCLDALQVDGYSSSGRLPAWRQFRLDRINEVMATPDRFEPDPGYDARSEKYRRGLIAGC